jgi:hypothetical protein
MDNESDVSSGYDLISLCSQHRDDSFITLVSAQSSTSFRKRSRLRVCSARDGRHFITLTFARYLNK